MKLLRVEFRRFWSRRLLRGMLFAVVVIISVTGVVTFVQHSPDAPTQQAIDATLKEDLAMCRQYSGDEWRAWDALGREPDYQGGFGEYLAEFESAEEFADEQCRPEHFGFRIEDPRYCLVSLWEETVTYREGCPDLAQAEVFAEGPRDVVVDGKRLRSPDMGEAGVVPGVSIALLLLAVVGGASFIGGDYRAGTMETTLLWEPRRLRVFAAKLTAGAVSAFVIHVVMLGFLVAVLVPSGLWRGTTAGVDAAFWEGLSWSVLRGGVAAVVLSVMAMTIVFVTRHTAGGVAVMLGYAAFSPSLVNSLLKPLRPRDVSENLFAFVGGGEVGRWVATSGYYESVVNHGTPMALAHILVYAVIAVVIGGFAFRRRDID